MAPRSKKPRRNQAPGNRRSHLNVIFFIDSNRTHSLKIPIKTCYWIAGALAFTLIWSITSGFLLSGMLSSSQERNERINSLLSTIFDYQTRYDAVYETAYPRETLVSDDADIPDGKPDAGTTTAGVSPAKQPAKQPVAVGQPPVSEKKAPRSRAVELNPGTRNKPALKVVKVEEIRVKNSGSGLVVAFSLRNHSSPERVEGYVWGVAGWQGADGNKVRIAAPPTIRLNDAGKPVAPKKASYFRIRYYKSHVLEFKAPKKGGAFQALHLYVDAKDRKLIRIPVDIPPSIDGWLRY